MKKTAKLAWMGCVIFFLICIFSAPAFAAPVKVAVIPFNINAEKDMAFLRNGIQDMLSSRLAWKDKVVVISKDRTLDAAGSVEGFAGESLALLVGGKLGADYVLYGSLTIFGDSVSIDAKMADVSGAQKPLSFFTQTQGMGEVIPNINQFATEINEKVFGRAAAQRPAASIQGAGPQASGQQPQAQQNIYAHPEKLITGNEFYSSREGGQMPYPMQGNAQAGGITLNSWRSPKFDKDVKGVAVGDIDGDKLNEVVCITDHGVNAYRRYNQQFQKLFEMEMDEDNGFTHVDIADANKNGIAEIFVTNILKEEDRVRSFVLEWNGSEFVKIAQNLKWMFRVNTFPVMGKLLLGQKKEVKKPFMAGVYEMKWEGGSYVQDQKLALSSQLNLYNFTIGDIGGQGEEMIVSFDSQDRIKLLTRNGVEEWMGSYSFGGTALYIESKSDDHDSKESGSERKARYFIPSAIVITDIDGDGKKEIITANNDESATKFLGHIKAFKSGHIEFLTFDRLGLFPKWRSRSVSGYISSLAFADIDNDGADEIVFSVIEKISSIIGKKRSYVAAYDLK